MMRGPDMAEQKLDETVDKVTFATQTCGGCRSCELACSFHHARIFQHGLSSIVITNTRKPMITFYRESAEGHLACDRCQGLSVPLCFEFCPSGGREELEELFRKHLSAPKGYTEEENTENRRQERQ